MKKFDKKFINSLKLIWNSFGQRQKYKFIRIVLMLLVVSVAEVVSIGSMIPFLTIIVSPDTMVSNGKFSYLSNIIPINSNGEARLFVTLLFCFCVIVAGLLRIYYSNLCANFSYAAGADVSSKIFEHTLCRPYLSHTSENSSSIISGITLKTNSVISGIIYPIISIISSITMMIFFMLGLVYLDPITALLTVLVFGGAYVFVFLKVKSVLVKNSLVISNESTRVIKCLQESLGGIRDVIIDSTQKYFCDEYAVSDRKLREAQATNQILYTGPRFAVESIGMISISMLAYVLLQGDKGIEYVLPIVGVLALSAQKTFPLMQQLYSSWSNIKGTTSILYDVANLLTFPVISFELDNSKNKKIRLSREISINSLSFKYPGQESLVLNDISFKIMKGERVGVIGKTGSGKSTLIDIIMGLIQTEVGEFCVDQVKIDNFNCNRWQSNVSHVPQSIFLADKSIAENIAFGVPKHLIDYERVEKSSTKAQLKEFINGLDDGFETMVGERGVRLSGGQRQRIGIARALYKESQLIVLDEATSALDDETERNVMHSIYSLSNDITVIIIAHRLSTLQECDYIIKLENGGVEIVND